MSGVGKLLANAPADKAWRRRGYLVLCRAHPDRLQQNQIINGANHATTLRGLAAVLGCHGQGRTLQTVRWMKAPVATGPLWWKLRCGCRREAYSGRS